MKKQIFIIFLLLLLSSDTVRAFDLDLTVDDDIRKNYNSTKLINDTHIESEQDSLPSLPEISKYEQKNEKHADEQNVVNKESTLTPITPAEENYKGNIKVSAGTVFDVVSATKINDWLAKGNSVKFHTSAPIVRRNVTIPANTVFYGNIIEVHRPQISCNGGLVVIRINKMVYKGRSIPISAYVTRADDKMIFLNNIKGDRTYLKTMWKKGNWGRSLFGRMFNMTVKLGGDGATLLFSPFPFAYGTICLGLNSIVSPITAFFSKGGHVSIPVGSSFKIRLRESVYID